MCTSCLKEGKRRQQKALPQSGFGFGVVAGCLITWLAGCIEAKHSGESVGEMNNNGECEVAIVHFLSRYC